MKKPNDLKCSFRPKEVTFNALSHVLIDFYSLFHGEL